MPTKQEPQEVFTYKGRITVYNVPVNAFDYHSNDSKTDFEITVGKTNGVISYTMTPTQANKLCKQLADVTGLKVTSKDEKVVRVQAQKRKN